MLLFKITNKDTSNVYYLSKQRLRALDGSTLKFWEPKVKSIGSISYKMDHTYGGMVRLTYGKLVLDRDTFDQEGAVPYLIDMEVRYMKEGEATVSNFMFKCTCYVTQINSESIQYNVKEYEIDVDVLDAAPDFGTAPNLEEDRLYPIAFGEVTFKQPLRVGTESEYQYWKGTLNGDDPSITGGNYDVYDDGRQKEDCKTEVGTVFDNTTTFYSVLANTRFTTLTAHNLSVSDEITFSGPEVALKGLSTGAINVQEVESSTAFWANTTKSVIGDYSFSGSDLLVTKTGDSPQSVATMSVRANAPRGTIRISGSGLPTSLYDLFEWGVNRINAHPSYSGYSIDPTYMNPASLPVSLYVEEQINVLDLLSQAAAFYRHLFYINDETKVIHVVDINNTQTPVELSTSTGIKPEFISTTYKFPQPIKQVKSEWTTYEAGTDQDDNPYFAEKLETVKVDGLTFGNEETVDVVLEDADAIKTALVAISNILQTPTSPVKIPFTKFDIVPGARYSWTDSKTGDVSVTITATSIQFNLEELTANLEGLIL